MRWDSSACGVFALAARPRFSEQTFVADASSGSVAILSKWYSNDIFAIQKTPAFALKQQKPTKTAVPISPPASAPRKMVRCWAKNRTGVLCLHTRRSGGLEQTSKPQTLRPTPTMQLGPSSHTVWASVCCDCPHHARLQLVTPSQPLPPPLLGAATSRNLRSAWVVSVSLFQRSTDAPRDPVAVFMKDGAVRRFRCHEGA